MVIFTAQKMNFSIKDYFSKCEQIGSFLQIWSHLLKKSLTEKAIFVQWVSCSVEIIESKYIYKKADLTFSISCADKNSSRCSLDFASMGIR